MLNTIVVNIGDAKAWADIGMPQCDRCALHHSIGDCPPGAEAAFKSAVQAIADRIDNDVLEFFGA